MIENIPDMVYSIPLLVAFLGVLMGLGLHWQKGLSYNEYIPLHKTKCRLFKALHPIANKFGRPLLAEYPKPENTDAYFGTVAYTPKEVYERIQDTFSPHLIATAKVRDNNFAHSQFVNTYTIDGDELQTEVFLFENPDDTVDIYVHVEPSITTPVEHTETWQKQGDVYGKFKDAWESR